jgi:hypothetical protein
MVDRELVTCLDAARVSFCLVGDRVLAVHGCAPRNGGVELLTVDQAVLRPLFWPDALGPQVTLGEPGDAIRGRVRWTRVPDHELVVGSTHAMVFAVDNARYHDDLGVRVATPLGLILLALDRGGPGSRADAVELIRAERTRRAAPWLPKVEDHLPFLPEAGRESWQLVLRDLDQH